MFFLNVTKPLAAVPAQLDLLYLILACIGVLIVLVCIGSFVFGYGKNFQDHVQEIKIFGADMKISVISFFILIGIVMVVPVVWTSFNNTVAALNKAHAELQNGVVKIEKDRDDARRELEAIRLSSKRDQVLLLELDNVPIEQFPGKNDIMVGYYDLNSETRQLIPHDIVTDGRTKRVKIYLKGINNETAYPRLEVVHVKTNQIWVFEDFKPGAMPVFVMKKEKTSVQ